MNKKKRHVHPSDIRALARLATDAVVGITNLVEAMHHVVTNTVINGPRGQLTQVPPRTRGVAGLVYNSIRGVARVTGGGVDALLAQLIPLFEERGSSAEREAVLAALNGVLGDYMGSTGNTLAIPMRLRRLGRPLRLQRDALAAEIPHPGTRIVVLVHGLCMNDRQWRRFGHDHGALLARELGCTPLYLHYNSGQHISVNGRAFSHLLEDLLREWPRPVEELVIIGHSMGGLVARSACHYGAVEGHAWLRHLQRMVFLGTPHHGAPLERIGNWIDVLLQSTRYSSPFASLGKIRSAGITDLRHGNLLDEDWAGRNRFARGPDSRMPLPLPAGIRCYTIAATLGKTGGSLGDRLLGDGLVPLASALGEHEDAARRLSFAPEHRMIVYETGHLDLLGSPDVFAQIRSWLADGAAPGDSSKRLPPSAARARRPRGPHPDA